MNKNYNKKFLILKTGSGSGAKMSGSATLKKHWTVNIEETRKRQREKEMWDN